MRGALLELLNLAHRVKNLFFARIEWMTLGTYLNLNDLFCRAYRKGVPTKALDGRLVKICRMNIAFHMRNPITSSLKTQRPLIYANVGDIQNEHMITLAEKQTIQPLSLEFEEMAKAGLQFGHKTSKTHPKMKPYIAGMRAMVHLFDLAKTQKKLHEALEQIERLVKEGKKILLVGTKVQLKDLVKTTALACGLPYVSERWIGGTLTNFETIAKRLERLHSLQKLAMSDEFAKYTKKEQLMAQRELNDIQETYGGLDSLTGLPDAVFVCDLDTNLIALREAKRKKIPVIALCDADINPTDVDFVIPANDDTRSSVHYILSKVQEAVLKAKKQPEPAKETGADT